MAQIIDFVAPMFKDVERYLEMKKKYPDAILLFRFADGEYQAYNEDADKVAEACGLNVIPVTGGDGSGKLVAFQHQKLDIYLQRLVRKGYRVAIVDENVK